MWATRRLLHQPMIKFLGKRTIPKNVDHSPHAHPAAPDHSLPESFAQYRNRAIQHGPLGGQPPQQHSPPQISKATHSTTGNTTQPYGAIGGHSGKELGPVEPKKGEYWDRDELPARFRRTEWAEAEIEAVNSAGASMGGVSYTNIP